MNRAGTAVALALATGLVAACAPTVNTRGNMVEDSRLQSVRPGVSTQADVRAALGPPTVVPPFEEGTWYYIGQVTEKTAFFEPEVVERRVVKVEFDEIGTVATIDELTLEEGQEVELVERETPTRGRQMGFLEQMIGNLGRFNTTE
jgi:outer membrane protein assembly factor BamE (lipoprotein component of BamABCDE complex)